MPESREIEIALLMGVLIRLCRYRIARAFVGQIACCLIMLYSMSLKSYKRTRDCGIAASTLFRAVKFLNRDWLGGFYSVRSMAMKIDVQDPSLRS